jgi:hypothetical protein
MAVVGEHGIASGAKAWTIPPRQIDPESCSRGPRPAGAEDGVARLRGQLGTDQLAWARFAMALPARWAHVLGRDRTTAIDGCVVEPKTLGEDA